MPILTATRGLPGSGKSTWAREQQAADPSIVIVSKDDLRRLLFASDPFYSPEREELVCQIRDSVISIALSEGRDVVVHDCNGNPKHIARFEQLAYAYEAQFTIQDFYVPVGVCIERDAGRPSGEQVGEEVIRRMARAFELVTV